MSGGGGGEQTVGYKYYSGDRLLLGHDTFDKVVKIRWGGKTAWEGSAEYNPANPGAPVRITVDKPNLFGGESREGGVSGAIDVLFGHSSQGIHSYLASKIQSIFLPAYRGVTSLVLRHFYVGNNPYVKDLGITAQRIHRIRDGELQWYDEKAETLSYNVGTTLITVNEQYNNGLSAYTLIGDSMFEIEDNALKVDLGYSTGDGELLSETFESSKYLRFSVKVITRRGGNGVQLGVKDANDSGIIVFQPVERIDSGNGLQRAYIQMNGVRHYFGSAPLPVGVWCDVVVKWLSQGLTFTATLRGETEPLVQKTLATADPFVRFNHQLKVSPGYVYPSSGAIYDNVYASTEIPYTTGEMNPAHMIREWLTHPVWGRGLPGSMIGDSYYTIADQLYLEGFGLSFYWAQEITHREAINEIQRHIDAVRYIDPVTGKLEIKLIRDDYDSEALPELDNSNAKVVKFDRKSRSELYNQITIKFRDRDSGDWATISLRDDTAIRRLGRTRNKTFEYPGIWRTEVALMVARRDLAANSREFARATIKTNRRVANLKPGDVFKLTDPKNGISGMICRVAQRQDTATLDGEITLEAAEDIFGETWSVYTNPTGSRWVNPVGEPQDFSHAIAFEKPYIIAVAEVGDSYIGQLNQDACYYAFAGGRPESGAHINYNLYVYPDGTTQAPDYEFAISGDFTPVAVVDGDVLNPLETIVPVMGIDSVESLRVGHLVAIGNDTDDQRELAAIDAEIIEGDLSITLKRGVADTLPRPIVDGTVLYFIGDHYAGDNKEYFTGETVEGYGTPVNGQGYYLGPYIYHDVEMKNRSNLPYPPANFKVDGYSFPIGYKPPSDTVTLAWRYRDRVLQSDQIIDWFEDADYGPEAGTTFRVESDAYDAYGVLITANWLSTNIGLTNTYNLDTSTAPANTAVLDVRVWSVRDGLDSLQAAEVSLLINGELLLTADGEPLITTNEYLITGS